MDHPQEDGLNLGFDAVWGGRGTPGPPAPGFFGPWPERANFPPATGNPNADDVMGEAAVRFIGEKAGEPFFLCFWLYGETRNLAAFRPDLTQRMSEAMTRYIEASATLLPRRNPRYDPNHVGGGRW